MSTRPEPWLRGPITGVHPITAPLLYSLQQAREDLAKWTDALSDEDFWVKPAPDVAPLGFQIRHIAGSIDRLTTYLEGKQLSDEQMADLQGEQEPGATRKELFDAVENSFRRAKAVATAIDPRTWHDPRGIGRKQLPTTVGGLITHMAEHTQRHVGEAIITAKLVRAAHSGGR
jgi:uncharacterized damage-inducible protein DinB